MENFKFYLTFICMILVLLPLQAQKVNFDKGREMLAPNAKQLAPTSAKQQNILLRSLRAAEQPLNLDLGDGLHLLPEGIDPQSTVVSATITSDQMANLPAILGDLMVSISNRIYEKFNDDFDFLFFALDRVDWAYADTLGGTYGSENEISNNVTGLGLTIYSNASAWGSGGKLKSAMFFPSSSIISGPSLHEICHNWANYIFPTYLPDNLPSGGHWGISNAGGQLGGFKYVRVVEENSGGVQGKTLYQASMYPDTNPDGSFKVPWYGVNANFGNSVPYSDIELYLMGMKSAQELRDAGFHLDIYSENDYNADGNLTFPNGYFYSTTKTSYTIDDIIALDGERIPDAAASQKQFKVLTVVITEEDSIPRSVYNIVSGLQYLSGYPENDITQYGYNFSQATNGKGSLITSDIKNSLKSNVGADVTGVNLDMATVSLPINTSKRLTATILPSNSRNKNVQWRSSDESVATVSSTGLITAVSEGEATITVTTENGSFSATCTVTITPALSDSEIFEVIDGVLVAYHGTGGDVVIPDNLGITKIGMALHVNSTITSVSIPEGVTQILDNAFNYCTGLTSITFPNSLETIGDQAFQMCTGLTSIIIPNSVKTIGAYAFSGHFTSVIIPKSVATIGDFAFGSDMLTSIQVDAENPAYSSEGNVLYNKDKTVLCQYAAGKSGTAFNIPSSVNTIGNCAFNGCNLTSITISNSVKSIGDYAFQACQNLTSIIIPNSVETIGNCAFLFCGKLTFIDVDAENSVYLSEDGILYNKNKTVLYKYPGSKDGTVFNIPNTVKIIGNSAFGDCSNLTSITIPNSVTEIGDWAFESCKLTSITIPYSVKSIGIFIFYSCDKLRDIVVHWKTPPTIGGIYNELAGLYNLYAITLHVPYGTKVLYEVADGWKEFGVIVEQDPVSVTGVSLDETSLSLSAGNTEQLTAIVLPEDAANSNLSWSSNDPCVATVSDNGLVTAQAAGTATITVKTEDGNFTATCGITVTASTYGVSVSSFSGGGVSANKTAATAGETVTLTILPDEGYELNVISAYKTDDETTVVALSGSGDTRTFTMPEYGVTVTATFKSATITRVGNVLHVKTLVAWMQNEILHVSGLTASKPWSVHDISGMLVYQGIATSERADIHLSVRGVYLVQSGNRTVKALY